MQGERSREWGRSLICRLLIQRAIGIQSSLPISSGSNSSVFLQGSFSPPSPVPQLLSAWLHPRAPEEDMWLRFGQSEFIIALISTEIGSGKAVCFLWTNVIKTWDFGWSSFSPGLPQFWGCGSSAVGRHFPPWADCPAEKKMSTEKSRVGGWREQKVKPWWYYFRLRTQPGLQWIT